MKPQYNTQDLLYQKAQSFKPRLRFTMKTLIRNKQKQDKELKQKKLPWSPEYE